jgi:hypothetical protein
MENSLAYLKIAGSIAGNFSSTPNLKTRQIFLKNRSLVKGDRRSQTGKIKED